MPGKQDHERGAEKVSAQPHFHQTAGEIRAYRMGSRQVKGFP
jgi:hypothetical protein